MKQGIKISIAMCTYNGEKYLQEQLDSFLQTRLPDELVICDDGSTDGTLEIIQTFAARAPFPVRVYHNDERLGVTKNFQKAIGLCEGDCIALSDQDDVWHSAKLQILESVFLNSPDVAIVFSDAEVVDDRLRPLNYSLWESLQFNSKARKQVRKGRAFDVMLNKRLVAGATMAFRSRFNSLILPIPCGWLHDAWIALLLSVVGRLAMVDRPLISYRQHTGNQIGARRRAGVFSRIRNAAKVSMIAYQHEWSLFNAARERILAYGYDRRVQETVPKIESKLAHLYARAYLPEEKWRRMPRVIKELVRLNYHRHSKGFLSVAADLFLHT
jgi:glycosyltransferase involved in cell wall biosynthesis